VTKRIKERVNGAWSESLVICSSLLLCVQVEPALIGGMVVTIGDKYIDMSMATKIKTYTNLISQAA